MEETNNSGTSQGPAANMNPTEYTIHAMRKEIDGMACRLIQFADQHEFQGTEPGYPKNVCEAAQEFQFAIKSLREAKMWLGETLKVHGSPLPAQYADKAEPMTGETE